MTVVDDLPDAFEWVAPAPSGCSIAGQKLTCDVSPASLRPAGTTVTINATARLKAGATAGTFDNRAYVTTQDDALTTPPPCTDTGAIEANNNVDCESTPVNPIADMAIVKNASQSQVGAGGGFNWVLDITNNGPSTATNVVVGDIVPSQLTVTGVSSSQFNCTHTGNSVTCTKASMAVGETGQVTIAVSVPSTAASGTVVNVGTVEATTPDTNLSNNSDDASVVLVAQAAADHDVAAGGAAADGFELDQPIDPGGVRAPAARWLRDPDQPPPAFELGRLTTPSPHVGAPRAGRPHCAFSGRLAVISRSWRVCRFVKVFDNRLTCRGLSTTQRGTCGWQDALGGEFL